METNILKILADPLRCDMLVALREGRLNAGEILERFNITPAALSYHLKMLKNADLVMEYKQKKFIFYELNTTIFKDLIIWVNQFSRGENEK